MPQPNEPQIPVFISSVHYGLEDLRCELAAFLSTEFGVTPYVSSETGFPYYHDNWPPYVGCLKAVEDCLLFIGIIDKRYGTPFDEWGPYPQYVGLSPTAAEFSHAMSLKKRMIVYVRDDVVATYDVYRTNGGTLSPLKLPKSIDASIFPFFEMVKKSDPAPWIEKFRSVVDIKDSIRKRLMHEIFRSLVTRETELRIESEDIISKFSSLSPEIRKEIAKSVDSKLTDELEDVQAKITKIEEKKLELGILQNSSNELEKSLEALEGRMAKLTEEKLKGEMRALQTFLYINLNNLNQNFVAGPQVLPHITDQQLALTGFAFTGYSQGQPRLDKVTYQKVPRRAENGAWRGCPAVLQFFGSGFAPTCIIETEDGGRMNFVNKWSGHYLEICVNDGFFAPFDYLNKKFRVVNSWIYKFSDWVDFSWDYDIEQEKNHIRSLHNQALKKIKSDPKAAYSMLSSILRMIKIIDVADSFEVSKIESSKSEAQAVIQKL